MAFLRGKAPCSHGGSTPITLVFLKWYWEDGENGVTRFPLLRWSLDLEEEGAWGVCPVDSVLRVVHIVRTWSDRGDFQINLDAVI